MKQAFYMRLSQADGDLGVDNKDESNSIENQRLLLQTFVDSREDLNDEVLEYVDDGYSGTNFDRPGFIRMIEDAKQGKIGAIMVKDLSRLGRDYITVGDYLEQIFPLLGIRFIAVNSNYDSNDFIGKTMGLEMSITNLVNTLYSRDLSKKYTSAIQTKWKRGISTMGRVPFGYAKDPDRKGGWVIDPEAAGYVRMIFDRALAGWSTSMIVTFMNEQNIPTPGQYRSLHDSTSRLPHKVADEEWMWDRRKVWHILKDYSYTGALVQGRTKPVGVGSRHTRKVKKENQFIVENTHEGIVTQEEYEAAQLAINRKDIPSMRQDSGFSLRGKIRCGNCRLLMQYLERATPVIYCGHARGSGEKSNCDKTRYSSRWIETVVLHSLNHQLIALGSLSERLEKKKQSLTPDLTAELKGLQRKLEVLRMDKIRLYERFADEMLTLEQYKSEKETVVNEIAKLQERYDSLMALGKKEESLITEIKSVQAQAESLMCFGKMTRKVAEAFIDTVYIYSAKEVEIVFQFDDLIRRATECLEQETEETGEEEGAEAGEKAGEKAGEEA